MDGFHPDAFGDRNRRCSHDTPRKGHSATLAFRACTAHKKGAGAVQGHRTATLEVERGGAYSGSSATMVSEMTPTLTPTPTLTLTLTLTLASTLTLT